MRSRIEKSRMRAFSALALASFLLGLVSGPVRSCFSHPGHGGTEHHGVASYGASHQASQHMQTGHAGPTASSDASNSTAEGCDCLTLCQVEHSPLLYAAHLASEADDPSTASRALRAPPLAPHVDSAYPVPLARPPPQIV